MTPEKAKDLAREALSDKRFYHTECVAAMAKELAERYGCDTEDALVAGFLHDLLKEREKADLLQMIKASAIIEAEEIERCPALYHAFAGGIYARDVLGVKPAIADAISYHTTGRAGMTKLEKITYLADYISADRCFPGVEEVREKAEKSLDLALFAAMRNQLIHLAGSGKYIDVNSVAAYNDLSEKGDFNV